MSRSCWKIPYIPNILFSKLYLNKENIQLWKRSTIISSFFLNKKFTIHNGRWKKTLVVSSNMIGLKFGEFSITKVLGKKSHTEKKD